MTALLVAYAKDKAREHPTFCLMSVQPKEKLRAYLNKGERRLLQFMNKNGARLLSNLTNEKTICKF